VPIDYSIDHDKRRVICVWLPPIETEDLLAILERAAADGAWSYGMLHDARAVHADETRSTRPLMEAVNRLSHDHGARGPVAIIANADQVGRAEAYAIRGDREGHAMQVFWDREHAEAWLDTATKPAGPDARSRG
jgi:hypothetical protein